MLSAIREKATGWIAWISDSDLYPFRAVGGELLFRRGNTDCDCRGQRC
ncbi:MAG: hypothetical protein CM1200mP41_08560 [Gammaproteobacteria bacterium]|nr:MAG: hypothetical protein CM1200mP41_08560 [Gammaproteobacteria bacterium]